MIKGVIVIVAVVVIVFIILICVRSLVEYITYIKYSPSGNRQTAENIIKLCNTGIQYTYHRNTDIDDHSGFSVTFYDKGKVYDVGFSSYTEYKKFAKWNMHNNSDATNKQFNDMIARYSSININKWVIIWDTDSYIKMVVGGLKSVL